MTKRLLLMGLLVAVLVAADRALQSAQAARRAESLRIASFAGDLAGSSDALAAVRIESGAGESWLFGRKQGQWRCLSWRGAVADGDAVLALVSAVTDAVGVPLSERPANPAEFGLDLPTMFTISLHGPKVAPLDPGQDRLLAVDIGAPLAAGAGCFARRHGESSVWSIDTSPAAGLARAPGERIPPLVDRQLVPAAWPGLPLRVQRLRVEIAGLPPYELSLEAREVSREEFLAGKPPFKWYLVTDGVAQDCAELLAVYFANHVVEARWTGLADPALADHIGLDRPRAKLTLMSGEAEPLELILGARLPGNVPAVWVPLTGQLCELRPDDEALLFPPVEAFAPDAQTNPWDR
jgi:hypothetical protein